MVMYFSSFLLVIECSDWFLVWMGLEINMMSFILLMFEKKTFLNSESCVKYFFIQSLGSLFFMSMLFLGEFFKEYFVFMILNYKIGGGIFYFWFIEMSDGMSWISLMMLMIFQKIIPLMIMSNFIVFISWVMIFLSLTLGVMGSFNQLSLRRLMAFSSIHHLGWMMICMMINSYLWILYLFLYFFVILGVMLYFNKMEFFYNKDIMTGKIDFFVILGMLNMGGFPPMLGFFLKMISLKEIMYLDKGFLLLMVILSVVMLYVYLRVIYMMILGSNSSLSWGLWLSDMNFYSMDMGFFMGFVFMPLFIYFYFL